MLAAHLDQATDAASHRRPIIDARVDHLVRALALRQGDRLLDLGCGPGLYAEVFARRGLIVSGIDISPGSIDHARARAAEAGLEIAYRIGDYTTDPLGGPFDAAVMIYLDFGVLADGPRDRLLAAVHNALEPEGTFAFDVHTPARPRVAHGATSVSRHERGFWRPHAHTVTETRHLYPGGLDLTQYAVADPDGTITTYRVWDRAYSRAQLQRVLARQGFDIAATWSDLDGDPWRPDSPTIAVAARTLPVAARVRGTGAPVAGQRHGRHGRRSAASSRGGGRR